MHFVLQTPSLQHLAGVRIVAHLWSQADNFSRIRRLPGHEQEEIEWKALEERVQNKVSVLPLPETCKKQLFNFIKPLGMEIVSWWHYHRAGKNEFLDILLGNQLFWTMHGIVDYAKTAELMVKDERLSIERRYEVACINCLEVETGKLFDCMSEERRREYVKPLENVTRTGFYDNLIVLFTRIRYVDQFPSMFLPSESLIKKSLFENSLCCGNRATCEYLFNKLDQLEKEQVLEEFEKIMDSCNRSSTCSLLYYLSLLNEEQQRPVFQESIIDLLMALLRWPMQSLFKKTAEFVWSYLDREDCLLALFVITRKFRRGYQDFDYVELFWKCWQLNSADSKLFYFEEFGILKSLLLTKREDFFTLILNIAPSRQVEKEFNEISQVLMDENVISDAALMECKETAALISSNDRNNVEKRLRSQHLSRLVDVVMEGRIKKRL